MQSSIVSQWRVIYIVTAILGSMECETLLAQSTATQAQRVRARVDRRHQGSEDVDRAAGKLVDSLFEPIPPSDPLPRARSSAGRGAAQKKAPPSATGAPRAKAAWKGRLVRNPKTDDGRPPFVIIDRYGGVQRYVESSQKVDLNRYVGQYVTVRRDTGDTLLADQLLLPNPDSLGSVRTVAHEEGAEKIPAGELVPVPADESVPMVVEGEPIPMGDEGIDFVGVHEVPYEGEVYSEGDYGSGLHFEDGPCDGGGCPTCGSAVCATSLCGFGSRPIVYIRGEYLLWWMDGMNTPPLVVEDRVSDAFQNAEVIYGGDKVLEQMRSGGRISLGYWLDDYGKWAVEGDYLRLESLDEQFVAGAKDGRIPNVFIGRPFINGFDFDANGDGDVNDPGDIPRGRAVEEVDTRGLDGSVTVDLQSQFQTAGLRLRRGLCCCAATCGPACGDGVACGAGVGCGDAVGGGGCGALGPIMGVRRIDATFGARWAQLDERLHVTEDLQTRDNNPTTFFLQDQFDTSNEFIGGDFGFLWEWQHRRLSLEILSRLALGSTRQRVRIFGSTLRDEGQETENLAQGGLLALPSNIGVYTRDQFSVMPELGATFGYLVTDRLRFTVGYTFLYWSNVVRPGDQIDNVIDITQVPVFEGVNDPDNPAVVPRFTFRETGLWAQGVNLGLDYRW